MVGAGEVGGGGESPSGERERAERKSGERAEEERAHCYDSAPSSLARLSRLSGHAAQAD
jgi:hypothetical protein